MVSFAGDGRRPTADGRRATGDGRRATKGTGNGNREQGPSIGTVAIPPFVAGAPLGKRCARDDNRAVVAAVADG